MTGRIAFERACRAVAVLLLLVAIILFVRDTTLAPDASRGAFAADTIFPASIPSPGLSSPEHGRPGLTSRIDSTGIATGSAGVQQVPEYLRNIVLSSDDGGQSATRRHGLESSSRSAVLVVTSLPDARVRAALGSAVRADVAISWIDRTLSSGLAIAAEREATPLAAIDIRASNAKGSLKLHDAGGALDSIAEASDGSTIVAWRMASLVPPIGVSLVRNDSLRGSATLQEIVGAAPRRLLVIATPGWETKFTVAALEEAGWEVDGKLRLSPSAEVTIGKPGALTPDRYGAVLVLDSTSVNARELEQYVQRGGGLVISGDAIRIQSLRALSHVHAVGERRGIAGGLLTERARSGLDSWILRMTSQSEGIVLQRRMVADQSSEGAETGESMIDADRATRSGAAEGDATVVGRRHGAGRVVVSAYRETWRWRMQGSDSGPREHRDWWTSLVAMAVGGPTALAAASIWPGSASPYADMVSLVGNPVTESKPVESDSMNSGRFAMAIPMILFGLIVLLLLSEWTSRRFRGAT